MSETITISKAQKFLSGFTEKQEGISLNGIRSKAIDALVALDFPTTKTEEWKYTRVAPIINKDYAIVRNDAFIDLAGYRVHEEADLVVFVNGFFRADLSTLSAETGVIISSLKDAKEHTTDLFNTHFNRLADIEHDAFTALNTALTTDGAFVHVARNTVITKPIHLLHIVANEGCTSQLRNLILVEDGAQVAITQTFESLNTKSSFTNAVTEASVAGNATCTVNLIQNEGHDNYHINSWYVNQAADSNLSINTACIDGALIRNGLNVMVNGTNCHTNLNGIYLPTGSQHMDNHTLIDHKQPHCESNELYKGIMYDRSTGVFNGKVYVRPNAQKVNAFQQNNNILIGDDANVNSKPELEIYADDVKCSHGSTTGQFDEEAVFYLQTRGIGEDSARKMLIGAFTNEVLERIESDAVREKIETLIAKKLNATQ